jgi:alkylhydroperoxidase/carboxymuconolactone decarboxylase family protein YurZ
MTATPRARPDRTTLSASVAAACRFAAAMTRGLEPEASEAVTSLRATGAPRRLAEECALMLMLYAGYPAALEGLRVLNAAWPGRARRSREGGPVQWRSRGVGLCRRVYGPAYAKLVPAVRALHPDLATWMIEHGYGRVLARAGANTVTRELVTIASLASLGWERQLVSHVLGAVRVGASPEQVLAALELGAERADARARAVARRTGKRFARTGVPAARGSRA